MTSSAPPKIAILRRPLRPAENPPGGATDRVRPLFEAFARLGAPALPVTFEEDHLAEVRRTLLGFDAVLVFVDPINPPDGRDRSLLDPLLREVAAAGVVVSTHPEVILKMGTKEVLWTTRDLPWGSDVHAYRTAEQLAAELPARVALEGPRVLKQYRGNGGDGVWKVEPADVERAVDSPPTLATPVRVLHAQRGSTEEVVALEEFLRRMRRYIEESGPLIDQPFQPRLPEGQIRVYVVVDRVAGFGLQHVKALMPAPPGSAPADLEPEPRTYYDADLSSTQPLRRLMDEGWIALMQDSLGIATDDLPLLWDIDFLLGPRDAEGRDTYVLCEINVSSVIPFPPSAAEPLARATIARARRAHR